MPDDRDRFDDLEPTPDSRKGFWLEFGGAAVLILGLLGYGAYQWWIELGPDLSQLTQPSPSATPTPTPTISPSAMPTLSPSPIASPGATPSVLPSASPGATIEEIYQRSPKSGTFYAENPLLSTSRREVGTQQGRICIRLVNGPVQGASGEAQVVVSSVSTRNDGLYIDATTEKLQLDPSGRQLQDSMGSWQWLEGKVDREGLMAECLSTPGVFAKQEGGTATPTAPTTPKAQ